MTRPSKTDILRPTRPPIPSSCTPERLAAELAAANLQSIEDPDMRALAFMDTITRLIIETADSTDTRAELLTARLEAARRHQTFR
jgi:hypothetical protein